MGKKTENKLKKLDSNNSSYNGTKNNTPILNIELNLILFVLQENNMDTKLEFKDYNWNESVIYNRNIHIVSLQNQ